MDFAFTDEQDALREGVRNVLDTECTPDALRAFEMADEEARVSLSQNRWAVLAELGAPALVVPEAADGLGLSDVDLVGVLEEAGGQVCPSPCSKPLRWPLRPWPHCSPTRPRRRRSPRWCATTSASPWAAST